MTADGRGTLEGVTDVNDQLELRPVREDDLPLLEKFTFDRDTKGEFQWFGWSDLRQWRQGWDENGLIGPDGGTLLVVLGEEKLGAVVWHRRSAGPAAHSWELGIAMFPPSRGRGYGTQAHRLITGYLFAHTAVHRIEALTDVANLAEQKALERAGFTREGVARGVAWRDGAWRDGVIYSILRTDPQG